MFPWVNTVSHCTTVTSKVAAYAQQRCDILRPLIDEVSSNIDEQTRDHRFNNAVDDVSIDATYTEMLSSKVNALE